MKVRIIGAGFSGLTLAYALVKKSVEVELVELTGRSGGLLNSERTSWGLIESAANGLIATAPVEQLARDIGIELVATKSESKKRYIYRGSPRTWPLGLLESFRFLASVFVGRPRRKESLEVFSRRKFGVAATKYLIEPAIFGIFGNRLEKLSGTLIYNYFFKWRSEKAKSLRGTVAPKEGMGALVGALREYLKNNGVQFRFGTPGVLSEDCVTCIATDATSAAEILDSRYPKLSSQLRAIKYSPLKSISLGFPPAENSLEGFGCLFPADQGFHSLGVLFNHHIFPDRGPMNTETWMLQGDEESDVLKVIGADRERLVGFRQVAAESKITSWPRALPVYSVQLEEFLQEHELPENVFLTGNYLGRIGLAKILDQNIELADRIVANES